MRLARLDCACLVLCLFAVPLSAAPRLVRDQNAGASGEIQPIDLTSASTSPGQTVLYFRGSDPDHGTELWRSDGTPDGTWRVTDVCPGRCDGLPGPVTVLAGQLFFTADDGVSGRELWRSDGTPGGERRVRDLCPGPCSLGVSGIATLGGRALFAASAGSRRRALWSTRGSRRSTAELKTVCTVPLGLDDCVRLGEGQRVGGWVFFQILIDSAGHSELWRTDGTAAGTGPLREVVAGGSFLSTGAIFPTGLDSERGFFWTADALWRTDGTPAGTVPVKTLRELLENPQGSSSPGPTAVWNGELYTFLSTGEVVRSDGTPAGTVRITTLGPSTRAAAVVPTPAHLFFLATDADGTPNQVWRTRGTAETTELILDTRPSFLGRSFAAAGDRLLFGVSETGLWSSDGTVSGTAPIGSDLGGHPGEVMVSLGDLAVFPKGSYPIFDELWSSDGTPAGTLPVRDFSALPGGAGPIRQTVLDNRLVYSGWADSVAPTLLSSDGNVSGIAGTRVLSESIRWPGSLLRVGRRVFFSAEKVLTTGSLGTTDGTPAGTSRLTTPFAALGSFSALGNQLLFAARLDLPFNNVGLELWHSNGTSAGTGLILNINPFAVLSGSSSCANLSSSPGTGVALGSFSIFAADDGRYGRELWRSNGTADGTRLVRDINAGRVPFSADHACDLRTSLGLPSNPEGLLRYRNGALFTADDGGTGRELWWTDGTAAGTRRVIDLRPGGAGSAPHDLTVFRQLVYFIASVHGNGEALWRTDGTAKGTIRVDDLTVGGAPSWARGLTVAGNRLFFSVYNEATGAELWVSDGSSASTGLVTDLRSGAPSSAPQELTAIGNVLVFAADDGEHGVEPWRSDGTAAGTRRLGDISPGRDASSPGPFSLVGSNVLTGADDGVHGRELWAIPVQDVVP